MKNTLELLTDEHKALNSKIAELEAQRAKLRADMEADPLKRAAALAPRFGEIGVQLEVFNKRLGDVTAKLKAEQKRLNSPEVKNGIKRAETIAADGAKLRDEMVAQAQAMLSRIDAAQAASIEAADLLKIGGQSFLPYSGPYTELAELRQIIGGYLFARSERANITAGFKQAAQAAAARNEAKVKAEAEAKARAEAAKAKEAARHEKDAQEQRRAWGIFSR